MPERTVNIPQACELAGVSRRTIYHWMAKGKVKYVRTAGGLVRIFASTLFQKGNVTAVVTAEEAQPRV